MKKHLFPSTFTFYPHLVPLKINIQATSHYALLPLEQQCLVQEKKKLKGAEDHNENKEK